MPSILGYLFGISLAMPLYKEGQVLNTLSITPHIQKLTESLHCTDPVWKAWRTMKETGLKRLPVQKNGKIVGIVSDRDIVQISGYNGGQSMPVQEAMSLDPLVITENETVQGVIEKMLHKEQHHAIVISATGELCGLLSWDQVFQVILGLFLELNPIKKINP